MKKISLSKDKIKILLLEGIHESALETLKSEGYTNIDYVEKSLPDEELKERIRDAYFVGIRSRTQITREVLDAAPRLMAVGCFCIGTNQVDLTAALEKGVVVFNAPFSNTRSVAELVLGEIIMLMRGVPERSTQAHRGVWNKSATNSYEVRGKKLGIVGYGHIGTQLGILAEDLGMKVYFTDIEKKLTLGNAEQVASLDKLLEMSDIISFHVPSTPQTLRMMGPQQFAKMKDKSILINASRGGVVDIDALTETLKSGKLLGAAIDVFPVEPKSNQDEFLSPLRAFDNVILTPHVGGSTLEAQANIGAEVADKLSKYSDNGSTLTSVNFPEVSLPIHENCCRLLHIHHNVPGVITRINEIFARHKINIAAQYLQTNDKTGYVVMDVADEEQSRLAIKEMGQIEGTIKARLLY